MKLPIFLLCVTLLLVFVHSQVPPPPPIIPPAPNTPVMRYVLQWPPTFCIKLRAADPRARCSEPIPQQFMLHGIWPADGNGHSITKSTHDCGNAREPNWKQLLLAKDREIKLETFWKTLRAGSKSSDLWKHEWREHGVCARPLITPETYFDTAISINGTLGMMSLFDVMRRSGVIACDSLDFQATQVVQAVQKVFGTNSNHDVYLSCIRHNRTHDYLSEVTLCFNADDNAFTSCPSAAAPRTCRNSIMLPHP